MPASSPSDSADYSHPLAAAFQALPLEQIARSCGFLRRRPKKVHPGAFLQLCCLLALQTQVSLRAWACLWGLLTNLTLSKQAMAKRCSPAAVAFVRTVLECLLGRLITPARQIPQSLRCFGRVIIQDSTTLALNPKLAACFPGPRNQSQKPSASLKIQVFYDLLSQRCLHFWLSPFTTNDQKASPMILALARRGDLIIRDLGYLVLEVLAQAQRREIYFLSRWRNGIMLLDPDSGAPLDLLAQLRLRGCLDTPVLLGQKERLPARLIAIALPAPVAAERRRKALANRDRRLRPSKERLALLSWEIFITNVPPHLWSARAAADTYRLRWRIEILFKAWKSHFRLGHFTNGSASQVQLLVYGRLLWIALFKAAFLPPCAQTQPLSVLKLAAFCQDYFLFPLLLLFQSPLDPSALLKQIAYHCRSEPRRKRHPILPSGTTSLS
jgi:Transposase DDE domain